MQHVLLWRYIEGCVVMTTLCIGNSSLGVDVRDLQGILLKHYKTNQKKIVSPSQRFPDRGFRFHH